MSVFLFPKDDFGKYASAEIHTIKPKLPRKLKFIVAAVVVVAGLFWFALGKFSGPSADATGVSAAGDTTEHVPRSQTADASSRRSRALRYTTAAEYATALTPRIPDMLWTAPAFDGREVASDPHVYCIASGFNGRDGCRCVTEQGTRYVLDRRRCMDNARYGEGYNPFKPSEDRRRVVASRGAGGTPAVDGADAPAPALVGIGAPGQEPAPAGTFRSQ